MLHHIVLWYVILHHMIAQCVIASLSLSLLLAARTGGDLGGAAAEGGRSDSRPTADIYMIIMI